MWLKIDALALPHQIEQTVGEVRAHDGQIVPALKHTGLEPTMSMKLGSPLPTGAHPIASGQGKVPVRIDQCVEEWLNHSHNIILLFIACPLVNNAGMTRLDHDIEKSVTRRIRHDIKMLGPPIPCNAEVLLKAEINLWHFVNNKAPIDLSAEIGVIQNTFVSHQDAIDVSCL
ncbi:hypothetical protein TSH7_25370 [Azospirillum sp. TSH7]|nr:hypothetical protein TSH7_25370 [Azospirillum sp. TSH7]PWC64435.1 hypothetical protein TSH20_18340 [Azospirillum sp. TSH20]